MDVRQARGRGLVTRHAGGQGRADVLHGATIRVRARREDRQDRLALRRPARVRRRPRRRAGVVSRARGRSRRGRPRLRRHVGRACHRAAREDRRARLESVLRRQPARQGPGDLGRTALLGRTRHRGPERRQRLARPGGRARPQDRQGSLALLRDTGLGRERPRLVAVKRGVAAGRRRRVARRHRRSGDGLDLLRHRQRRAATRRRRTARQQPLPVFGHRARREDRRPEVALPGHSSRHLGGRHLHLAGVVRRPGRRPLPQGHRRDAGGRVSLHARS